MKGDYMSIARQPMLDLMADRPELVNGLFELECACASLSQPTAESF